ncbi:MAG: right-handed parallel beta-helix repeat-containing protein, partial [Actinomycetia bacterium]|nr:right-handed parallel beta-helix repeat-containing protein [Actinomycetes bacterium]
SSGTIDTGIEVSGDDNVIGSAANEDRNVISPWHGTGVHVLAGSDRTTIENNHLGLDDSGSTIVGVDGVAGVLTDGDTDTLIQANLISGNTTGVILGNAATSTQAVVNANTIGLDITGLLARPNLGVGIDVQDAASATISNNTISGNGSHGVSAGVNATLLDITGNQIGLDGALSPTVGNGGDGVRLTGLITNASITGNDIAANTGLGIDLGGDGVTTNDAGDADTGSNGLANHPEVTATRTTGGSVTVDFDLDVSAGNYRVEVFTNPGGADPSGYGEGEVYESATVVAHGGTGSESFQITYSGAVGDVISLTATQDFGGSYGSTSEFSAMAEAVTLLDVNSTGDSDDATPGDGQCDTGGLNADGDPACTLRAAITEANALVGGATIDFAIPQTEPNWSALTTTFTISPATALPAVTGTTLIDATTQAEFAGVSRPVIVLDGGLLGGAEHGLEFATGAADSLVSGFAIGNFDGSGIRVAGDGLSI